jgi:flagellar biogenesis protein FliO
MFNRIKKEILGNARNKKILITIVWVSAVLFVLILAAGSGGVTSDTDSASTIDDFNIGAMVFGTFIRLLLVLALIYGIFSIYRLFQKGNARIYKRRIEIIDTQRFSAKQAITILRVDNHEMLIGLTDHTITLLKELDNTGEISDFYGDELSGDDVTFRELLDKKNEKES